MLHQHRIHEKTDTRTDWDYDFHNGLALLFFGDVVAERQTRRRLALLFFRRHRSVAAETKERWPREDDLLRGPATQTVSRGSKALHLTHVECSVISFGWERSSVKFDRIGAVILSGRVAPRLARGWVNFFISPVTKRNFYPYRRQL